MIKGILKNLAISTLAPLVAHIESRLPPRQTAPDITGNERELDRLRHRMAERTPDNPALHGFKAFSQSDEDGIMREIFGRLSARHPLSHTCLEIGCGNGTENNTHYLLLQGWKGCWIDGSSQNLEFIQSGLGGLVFPNLRAQQCLVNRENIAPLIAECTAFLGTRDIGFFSLDVDGNDLFLLQEVLRHCSPQVLCVEYNPKFPPPFAVTIRYNADHAWTYDDYHGASLQAYCDTLTEYRLICCNLSGINAFFVRQDLADTFTVYPPADLYQPFRPNLTFGISGHAPTLKWLRDRLTGEG